MLQEYLEQYLKKGFYPLHMPGHKRRGTPVQGFPTPLDVTELTETDDLHAAEGILRDCMNRTAAVYGADRTWYLVNGSTCGNLAAIAAATRTGDEVIVARNCHRSVYHALELRRLRVHYARPEYVEAFGLCGSVTPETIQMLLEKYPGSRCVILTSPTYEGIVSDIRSIARICHSRGVTLLVDEAHGAHFSVLERESEQELGSIQEPRATQESETTQKPGPGVADAGGRRFFPVSAIQQGADLVVQSPHKTLNSVTQTAWLHLRRGMVEEQEVERQLGIFESSSPSYPLLCSLDGCTEWLLREGRTAGEHWKQLLLGFQRETGGLRHFSFLTAPKERKDPAIFALDPGKLLFRFTGAGKLREGSELAKRLREEFGLETEMHSGRNVLAMTSPLDDEEGLLRLARALRILEQNAEKADPEAAEEQQKQAGRLVRTADQAEQKAHLEQEDHLEQAEYPEQTDQLEREVLQEPEIVLLAGEAVDRDRELVPWDRAAGRVSGEYLYCYPPGIPLLVPGERIREGLLRYLLRLRELHCELHGTQSGEFLDKDMLCCVK